MKTAILAILALTITGCENGNITLTKESTTYEKELRKEKGLARIALFKECMNLAANMPRQADDDVSDIVDECSQSSYYMTNYMTQL